MEFNFVIGHKKDGIVSPYMMWNSDVFYGDQYYAEKMQSVVQERAPEFEWKIYKLVEA